MSQTKHFSYSPDRRVMAFFFAQSMSVGLANSFAGIWFDSRGLSAAQIGVINAVPVFVLLLVSLSVGKIADRSKDWRHVIIVGAILSALFPMFLFGVSSFTGTLVFWTLAVIAQWAIVPVADAAALRFGRRQGVDLGRYRAWGTIGYLLVIFLAGYFFDAFDIALFLPIFVALCLVRAVTALALPPLRDQEPREHDHKPSHLHAVLKPWFLMPIVGWAMVYATHLVLNAFQGLLWSQQGISNSAIGTLIGLGAVAETVMFFAFGRFFKRYSARNMILLAAIVSVIRWVAMSYAPGLGILVGLQLLHSITYAFGFLACTNFIANGTSDDIAAQAQSLLVTLEQAIAIVALIAFGWFAGRWGAGAYWVSAGVAGIGAVLVFMSGKPKT